MFAPQYFHGGGGDCPTVGSFFHFSTWMQSGAYTYKEGHFDLTTRILINHLHGNNGIDGLDLFGGRAGSPPPPPTHPPVRQWGGGTKLDNGNINCEGALAQPSSKRMGSRGRSPRKLWGFIHFRTVWWAYFFIHVYISVGDWMNTRFPLLSPPPFFFFSMPKSGGGGTCPPGPPPASAAPAYPRLWAN